MQLYNATGATSTGTNSLRVTKPICALLIRTDNTLSELESGTMTITLEIERQNGNNTVIASQVPLIDFILGGVYGQGAVYYDQTFVTCAKVNLSMSGMGLFLAPNETLLVKLEGLTSAKTYSINGIEEPNTTPFARHYDRKSAVVGETVRRFEVAEYESAIIKNWSAIVDVTVTYANGLIAKFTKDEFVAISTEVDPILQISSTGVVTTELAARMAFPIIGVTAIEINKASGTQVDICLLNEKA